MSYAVELTPACIETIRQLPVNVAENVFDEIDRLAEQPTFLSRPSLSPLHAFQIYQFSVEADADLEFTIFFQYGQDEQTLHILRIGITRQ